MSRWSLLPSDPEAATTAGTWFGTRRTGVVESGRLTCPPRAADSPAKFRSEHHLVSRPPLRDRLRAGAVWVDGSRDFRRFDAYLPPAHEAGPRSSRRRAPRERSAAHHPARPRDARRSLSPGRGDRWTHAAYPDPLAAARFAAPSTTRPTGTHVPDRPPEAGAVALPVHRVFSGERAGCEARMWSNGRRPSLPRSRRSHPMTAQTRRAERGPGSGPHQESRGRSERPN